MVRGIRNIVFCIILLFLVQCDFEKEINMPLPGYGHTPYIECYLEPGKPYRLLAYKSMGYFESLIPGLITDADIRITHRGETITLPHDIIPREGDIRFYNYRSNDTSLVPAHYNEAFELSVTIDGVRYTSSTRILPPVQIDSIYKNCNSEFMCQLSVRLTDNVATADYYRVIGFGDSLGGDLKQDLVFNDELFVNENGGIGGRYNFHQGQKAFVRLYHLTKEHYDFLVSINNSQNANGNPFAQPASIQSNIPGLLGIFTGLSYDSRETHVVP
jgi:hypothetical protein